jgi:uncharacterized coiled-coil DUF342 family protein
LPATHPGLIDAIESAVATLREELARAEARADAAESLVAEMRAEIEDLKQARRTAREATQALLRQEGHLAAAEAPPPPALGSRWRRWRSIFAPRG